MKKYDLKRPLKMNVLIYCCFVPWGILFIVLGGNQETLAGGLAIIMFSVVMVIYEFLRSKSPKLIFDKNGFCIGDKQYSYCDIEKVKSRRTRFLRYSKIVVSGKTVFKFDSCYENLDLFIKELTLHNVEHNLL